MDAVPYLKVIQTESAKLLQLAARDPDRAVPSCPGWRVRDLCDHIEEMCREILTEMGCPSSPAGLEHTLRALDSLGLDDHDQRLRGLAHECAVHRWDAESASGEARPIDGRLARDGVDEFFDSAVPGILRHRGIRAGEGQTLHLHCADGEGEWFIVLDELPIVRHEHSRADAAVRGTASDLVLWLWGRIDPPEALGDRAVLQHLRAVTRH